MSSAVLQQKHYGHSFQTGEILPVDNILCIGPPSRAQPRGDVRHLVHRGSGIPAGITYPYGPYFGAIHGVILSICIAVGKHLSERVAYTGEENKKGCYYFHWLNRYGIELPDLVKYN